MSATGGRETTHFTACARKASCCWTASPRPPAASSDARPRSAAGRRCRAGPTAGCAATATGGRRRCSPDWSNRAQRTVRRWRGGRQASAVELPCRTAPPCTATAWCESCLCWASCRTAGAANSTGSGPTARQSTSAAARWSGRPRPRTPARFQDIYEVQAQFLNFFRDSA